MKLKWLPILFSGLVYLLCPSTVQAALKIGVTFFDPPLVMSATQGFQVDLANKICQGLQEQCLVLPMEWEQLFIALDKGEIDLLMGSWITLQRAKKYIFSIPFMPSKGQFIEFSANKITNFNQLKGLKVGTLRDETNEGPFLMYFRTHFPKSFFKIVEFKNIAALLTALSNNSVQAALIHSTVVNYWVANSSGLLSPLGASFPLGGGYAIMALPDKQQLIDNINQQIKQIKANGDFAKIYNTYFSAGEREGSLLRFKNKLMGYIFSPLRLT